MKILYLLTAVTGIIASFVQAFRFAKNNNILTLIWGLLLFILAFRALWKLRQILP